MIKIGIDASNISGGGGLSHLIQFLSVANPDDFNVSNIIVWAERSTLSQLKDRTWLIKKNPQILNWGLVFRILWQRFRLSSALRREECDVLFVPGGSYVGNFHPAIVMSQNLLPFEWSELKRYGFSFRALKMVLLRFIQSYSFRNADGVIFLTNYAQKIISKVTKLISGRIIIIPHGVSNQFYMNPKVQELICKYKGNNPYKILYVSTIDKYKHQCNVIDAIVMLRNNGFPLTLDLVGSSYARSLSQLYKKINKVDPDGEWIFYHGEIPYKNLHHVYANADLAIFASSCENMPITLLEKMASGLPIACSNKGPMPEILRDAGVYFNPDLSEEIASALLELINSPSLRSRLADLSFIYSQGYSWAGTASNTINYLVSFCKINNSKGL